VIREDKSNIVYTPSGWIMTTTLSGFLSVGLLKAADHVVSQRKNESVKCSLNLPSKNTTCMK